MARRPVCDRPRPPTTQPCAASSTISRRNSRRLRFLGSVTASDDLITRLCDNSDPRQALTLIVCRRRDDEMQIVGVGSYFVTTPRSRKWHLPWTMRFTARESRRRCSNDSLSFGTDQDFEYFSASVLPENFEMLDVFRDSGFDVHSTTDAGTMEVRLSLQTSAASIATADERDRQATIASLRAILRPGAVAVIGVSRRSRTSAGASSNRCWRRASR